MSVSVDFVEREIWEYCTVHTQRRHARTSLEPRLVFLVIETKLQNLTFSFGRLQFSLVRNSSIPVPESTLCTYCRWNGVVFFANNYPHCHDSDAPSLATCNVSSCFQDRAPFLQSSAWHGAELYTAIDNKIDQPLSIKIRWSILAFYSWH